jgi:hypothetical protein
MELSMKGRISTKAMSQRSSASSLYLNDNNQKLSGATQSLPRRKALGTDHTDS